MERVRRRERAIKFLHSPLPNKQNENDANSVCVCKRGSESVCAWDNATYAVPYRSVVRVSGKFDDAGDSVANMHVKLLPPSDSCHRSRADAARGEQPEGGNTAEQPEG